MLGKSVQRVCIVSIKHYARMHPHLAPKDLSIFSEIMGGYYILQQNSNGHITRQAPNLNSERNTFKKVNKPKMGISKRMRKR